MTLNDIRNQSRGNILIDSRGTITLGLLQAVRVSLNATNDILDGNDTRRTRCSLDYPRQYPSQPTADDCWWHDWYGRRCNRLL